MELYWVAGIGIVFLIALVVFIYRMPAERLARRRKPVQAPPKEVDWETVAKRWEKNNTLLNNEIESLKKERKKLADQIEDDQRIIREQTEQLAREKAWREKETQMVEKVKNVDHELKEELRKAQQTLDQEHSQKLKVDIELQEAKISISRFKEEVRSLTVKVMALEKQGDLNKTELHELRRTNTELKKQKEDTQWIAKSDYDAAVMKLKKAESELGRLLRDVNQSASEKQNLPDSVKDQTVLGISTGSTAPLPSDPPTEMQPPIEDVSSDVNRTQEGAQSQEPDPTVERESQPPSTPPA